MAHAGKIDIDKLNSALDETEKRKQHEAEMEKQLDEAIPRRFLIDMLGNLPLYHVGFVRLVKGANQEINEPLIKMSDLMNAVAELSAVDAEPVRHGYWIRKEWAEESEGLLIDNYECSACKSWVRNETNYCPNCGAKMDVERKEE